MVIKKLNEPTKTVLDTLGVKEPIGLFYDFGAEDSYNLIQWLGILS